MSAPPAAGAGRRGLLARADRSSLVLAVVLVAMGCVLAVDAASIESPLGSRGIGPAAFPWAVAGVLLVLGVVLAVVATRGRPDLEPDAGGAQPVTAPGVQPATAPGAQPVTAPGAQPVTAPGVQPGDAPDAPAELLVGSDRPSVVRDDPRLRAAIFVAGLVAHALLIGTAGYVVAALVLFVAVALAFGAPRLVRTLVVGAVLALLVFYAFTLGLGLGLPNFGGR